MRGVPDYLICINGIFIALELKRSVKEKTKGTLQELNILKIRRAGGLAFFTYPENWDKTKEMLIALSKGERNDYTNVG